MTLAAIMLVAAGAVLALLAAVQLLTWVADRLDPSNKRPTFIASVILGQDGRTSTSKTFILMWTLLVGWALIALLIGGELVTIRHCVHAPHPKLACAGHDVALLQVGWKRFLHAGLSGGYLVLLGVPAAAGIAAKGITATQVAGAGFKKPKPSGTGTPLDRITEIFSADDGTTDIGDFQYLIFNLVTATYFVAQFLSPDGTGLPTIPNTLLGLTSVSASLYVGKKAVSSSQPTVTGVFPMPLHDAQWFTVIGTELIPDPASPTDVMPQITIDGMPATHVRVDGANLVAQAPPNLGPGGTPLVRQLRVLNPYGGITSDFQVQCL